MAAPRESLNKATHSVGFHAKFVTVTAITADSLWAITTDRQFIETRVPLLVQRSKGPLPEVGDTWLIDQAMGTWTFAAFVGKSTADFAGKTVAMDVADLIYVQSSPPASPQPGDMWMNSARGNELSQWQGTGWVALQFGTDAIANKSITAAKLADKTVTAQQISDAAGITSSQVAFTIHDLGGTKVFAGTSQPAGMQPGDIWLNPAQGNAMATWDGALWHSLQFGALAIAPSSITAAQISGSAGIGPNQINFTAKDIGGITTSIAAAQPANPKIGDLWYDATNGYVLDQWNGTAWVPFQYGTNAIQAGSITAALIAANTITAAQIAAGTITAAQIAAGTITASLFAATGTNDYNAYLAGGDASGWRAYGGTFSVQTPAGAPYTYVAQIAADGVTGSPKIAPTNPGPAEIPCQPGNVFLVSALVWTTLSSVIVGATWNDSSGAFLSNSTATVPVTPSTWTYVYNIVTAPASAAFMMRFAGISGTPALGTILQATAISALSSFDGGVITAGTITAAQIAAGSITADNIQAGTITAGLLDANAIDGMTINGGTINGGTINATDVLIPSTTGGIFVYGTSTFPTVEVWSGNNQTVNWTAPPGITSVLVELWGSGGGGAYDTNANGGGGGAGGAYAASTITVVPGNTYTFHIGAKGAAGTSGSPNGGAGGDTTWQTTVVVAKGGGGGTATAKGTHQTGSVGTTVFQGGDGSLGTSGPPSFLATGGGGGGSAGSAANGKNAPGGSNNNAGAAAVSDGGPGGAGAGGPSGNAAKSPTTGPGGGGGAGCSLNAAGAAGTQGQVRLTYQNTVTSLSGAIAGSAGSDPIAGLSYNEGANFDHITDNMSGNRVTAAQTDPGTTTFATASTIPITNLWDIQANDVGGFTVYEVSVYGHGVWGSTAQALNYGFLLNGTDFTGGLQLDASTFNVNEQFNFEMVGRIFFTLNGASGKFNYFIKLVATSNSHTTQNGYTAIRRGTNIACNTTVLNQLQLAAGWASATGAPTGTAEGSTFVRMGN